MKNLYRVFLVFLLVLVVQGFGVVEATCLVDGISPTESPILPASGDSAALSDDFAVFFGPQCYWSPEVSYAGDDTGWIIITGYSWSYDPDLRTTQGGVSYTVLQNPGDARTGYITVGGAVFTVNQAGSCQINHENPLGGLADPGFGTGTLYVGSTECGEIVEITDIYQSSPKVTGSNYAGMVFGPDSNLYVADTARGILSVNPGDGFSESLIYPASIDFAPKFVRFNHNGDLLVTNGVAPGGLYVFHNANDNVSMGIDLDGSHTILATPGNGILSGVTVAANGDVLAVDRTNFSIWRFPFDPISGGYGEAQPFDKNGDVLTLTSPTGIARASNLKVLVGDGNNLVRISVDEDGDAEAWSDCATFPDGSVIQDVDISADDTLYVTVWNLDAGADIGQLYELSFNPASSVCAQPNDDNLLATFTGISGSSARSPLVGVAVPFWRQVGETSSPADEPQIVSFNDIFYEFTPHYTDQFEPGIDPDCTVDIVAEEISPSDSRILNVINGLIGDGVITEARPIINWGDNGRLQVYDFNPASANSTCSDATLVENFEHAINSYFSASIPQYVICHGGFDDPPLDCNLATFSGYFPLFGLQPGDGRLGGFDPQFSRGFMIDVAPSDADYSGEFCGFQAPLRWPTSVDDPDLPEFNAGSDMPVKFTVADTLLNGDCGNGPFVRDTIIAVMSLARVSPDFEVVHNVDITGGGSYEDGRIVFDNPANKNKPFALQVKLSEGGVNLAPGIYQLVVTDDTAASNDDPAEDDKYYFPSVETFFIVR